ncbi:hypothetical protein AAFF_G00283830 [Aldrovandia affinis]|uniref:Uncharacterized protein n=1 Tax=Aldrovandia affinis TaxID=143900 RepID=A0AAD7TBL4_9TELE|nr:hypothetical protein AAFF_G00283830 [Aldrovandia affinis]
MPMLTGRALTVRRLLLSRLGCSETASSQLPGHRLAVTDEETGLRTRASARLWRCPEPKALIQHRAPTPLTRERTVRRRASPVVSGEEDKQPAATKPIDARSPSRCAAPRSVNQRLRRDFGEIKKHPNDLAQNTERYVKFIKSGSAVSLVGVGLSKRAEGRQALERHRQSAARPRLWSSVGPVKPPQNEAQRADGKRLAGCDRSLKWEKVGENNAGLRGIAPSYGASGGKAIAFILNSTPFPQRSGVGMPGAARQELRGDAVRAVR